MKFKLIIFIIALLSTSNHLYANDSISKYLLFKPQTITIQKGSTAISQRQIGDLQDFINSSIQESSAGNWKLKTSAETIDIFFEINAEMLHYDAYTLEISKSKIHLNAKNLNALRYGKQSLLQLLEFVRIEDKPLPNMIIEDWANFQKRGYMLDISRDKVPTMNSLYFLIDQLADWRINELQFYTEHTFAYRNHQKVWENASPLTALEIQALDAYCLKKGIDLVPNQNSFGHMENWLKHDEYLDLSECETDCKTIWGSRKRTALAPTNPKSLELMQELYTELLPNFSSKYANIGGDETVELGLGKSKSLSEQIGKGQVYLDFLKKLNEEIIKNGKHTQFWGDIVLNHPELIKDIPKNMTALVWGYDATYPFDKNLAPFQEANLDFYVCPGTSSWRSEIGRNHNAFINLKNAAIEGKKYRPKGYLITDWGDYGHFQPKSVSYATLVLGASYAWNYSEKTLDNLEFLLNHYVFKDKTGYTAKALLTLGNAYLKAGIPEGNANVFHLMIRRYAWTMDGHYQTKHLNENGLLAAKLEIEKGLEELQKAEPTSKDAKIILKEVKQASHLALFGIHLGLERLKAKDMKTENIPKKTKQKLVLELEGLIEHHTDIWVVRNREGGLSDSVSKLEDLLNYLKK
ncbi:beta-N-acetylhexosaminidase [Xanthomarina gelatinilytica]|uniref:beta-N-acetylhexosaminidase n=1 Tax=Xanthomarina gelatinilytica TaxID=1137281 RepID=UPI0012DF1215|nr:family 20 glycosylhydrolase [Xanthomarina gelatinilytica]